MTSMKVANAEIKNVNSKFVFEFVCKCHTLLFTRSFAVNVKY